MPPESLVVGNKLKRSPPQPHALPSFKPAVDFLNDTAVAATDGHHHALDKRASEMRPSWALGYLSIPPRRNINRLGAGWWNMMQQYKYQRDDSDCRGQYVYVVENQFDHTHPVSLSPLFGFIFIDDSGRTD